jgi:hypothetical protein
MANPESVLGVVVDSRIDKHLKNQSKTLRTNQSP